MTGAALSFTAGVLLLQQQAALPAPAWLWLLPCCAALAAWRRALVLPAACACSSAAPDANASAAAVMYDATRVPPRR